MSVEVRPFGVKCNIRCAYCYQNPQRDAQNIVQSYDLERIKATIEGLGRPFTLFGGEPLMAPIDDLEKLWAWGQSKFGRSNMQTNGVLINTRHIALFKKYNVHVGISVDGPGALNRARWAGTAKGTERATQKTLAAIRMLLNAGLKPGIIVTLHRANASAAALPVLFGWLKELEALGIRSVRLHVLEVDDASIRDTYALTPEEQVNAFAALAALERTLTTLRFDVFADMRQLMRGLDNRTACVWNACDPYTTRAVQGVEGNGQRSNCGRTNKDGVDFVKADEPGFERYVALYHTPQAHGGCNGCRYFLVCKGQCPGTAIDGDWRNRTEHCELWKHLYCELETALLAEGEIPLSLRAEREVIEAAILLCWSAGYNPMIETLIRLCEGNPAIPSEKLAELALRSQ
jgi:uncharacterized protein